jgi:hypothetical protein
MWDLIQQYQIAKLDQQDSKLKKLSDERRFETETNQSNLNDRFDRLALICQAMWELLRNSNNFSEDILLKKVQELDLRDGKLDGKVTKQLQKCSACNKTLNPRHRKCIYCGEERLIKTAFEGV